MTNKPAGRSDQPIHFGVEPPPPPPRNSAGRQKSPFTIALDNNPGIWAHQKCHSVKNARGRAYVYNKKKEYEAVAREDVLYARRLIEAVPPEVDLVGNDAFGV